MADWERAKELFTFYQGSFIHMYREGVLDEYKGFEIAKEKETEWLDEMVNEFTKQLSIMSWTGVVGLESLARSYPNPTILENVATFASRHLMSADSVVKLIYAEKMIKLIKLFKKEVSVEVLRKAYTSTLNLLEDTIAKPLILDPGHELEQFNLKDKKALNIEAQRHIDELKQI
ncbi:hypothetical protein [Cohnella abietis]|uniref:Uncharacterized protein n=1 Tax=Cohnella abietis TaxID=2507935 RepID=A0A3T1D7U9_9BACL|nr:hypothetical protein [Cohnella abietis]BBI34160.1 hypothetical protein KCTCHS21_35590 [Cohnella abietis]